MSYKSDWRTEPPSPTIFDSVSVSVSVSFLESRGIRESITSDVIFDFVDSRFLDPPPRVLIGLCFDSVLEMALGRRCSLRVKRGTVNAEKGVGLGLGFGRCTRAFGRKRVAVWDDTELEPSTPKKSREAATHCDFEPSVSSGKSLLESMPQEVLISILCGVRHDDLKQLFHVSRSIREAALIAKQLHFAYRTPSKVVPARRNTIDFGNPSEHDEIETPAAPKRLRGFRSRLGGKKLAEISVALFSLPENDEPWHKEGVHSQGCGE